MEDHVLLNDAGVSKKYNEIETLTELLLTLIFQEDGALPDEADDIDETKGLPGFIAVVPTEFNFKSKVFALKIAANFHSPMKSYLNLVFDISPPPPKAQV